MSTNGKNLSLFAGDGGVESNWLLAPSPKPSTSEKKSFGKLVSLYTAFSAEFGSFVLNNLRDEGCKSFLDPFVGTGTLVECARSQNAQFTFQDLNPFSVITSLYRSTSHEVARRIASIGFSGDFNTDAQGNDTINWINQVTTALEVNLDSFIHRVKNGFIESPSDEDCMVALVIFTAAISELMMAKSRRGSNPTWHFKSKSTESQSPQSKFNLFDENLLEATNYILDLPDSKHNSRRRFGIENSCEKIIGRRKFDAVVTSPPYLNRIDYLKHYEPAAELLFHLLNGDMSLIRPKQTGTPIIRHKNFDANQFPKKIRALLNRVRTHNSYASSSYYYWGYQYYFEDMTKHFELLSHRVKKGGYLCYVVQNSFYKDIHVDLAGLLSEVAMQHGIELVNEKSWSVKSHMGLIATRNSDYKRKNDQRSESALLFRKNS